MTLFTSTITESLSVSDAIQHVEDVDSMARWVALLNSGWSSSSGGKKPIIGKIIDYKSIDVGIGGQDYVLVYPSGMTKKSVGAPYDGRKVTNLQSIDIRSGKDHGRIQQLRREVDRIMMANRTNRSATGFQVISGPEEKDLSDKFRNLYRYVLDYTGETFAERFMG
jgi:hypothetical protein